MKKIFLFLAIIILLSLILILINNKNYTIEEVNIKNKNNQNIYGELYKPKGDKKMPLVIYSHGLGATYRAGSDYAKELTSYGVMTLCFDFRGGSNRSKSDGKTTDMSIVTEFDDLETILNEVKSWDFVDKNNIVLVGSSQGGAVSSFVSSKHFGDIKGLILLYPALSIPNVVHNWYPSINDIPSTVQMTKSIEVGRKYFEDIWNLDLFKEIEDDEINVLILHGTLDDTVPITYSEKINGIYKNSEFYKIDGAGHGFSGKHFDKAMGYIIDYLKKINVIK